MIDRPSAENEARHLLDVFFYGLFMDADVLSKRDISGKHPRRACVQDFALKIGERATLTPHKGGRSYGMVYSLTNEAIDHLYSGVGLEDYQREILVADFEEGGSGDVFCFNLPTPPRAEEFNKDYAVELQSVLRKLGFPQEYVDSVV